MNQEIIKARSDLRDLVGRFKRGEIGYVIGKVLAVPYLKKINDVGQRIAKKHRRNFYPLTWSKLIR